MAVDTFNIGLSGLNAAKIALDTTGHNISNVNTPGYSRQKVIQSSVTPQGTGAGFLGQGTTVETVARQYNDFLQGQVNFNQSQTSYYESYSAQIKQMDDLLGDTSAGLSPSLQEFFSTVQGVANNPSSTSARQSMLSQANEMVGRFQTLDGQIQQMGSGVNQKITNTVENINLIGKKIADLNQKIVNANSYSGQSPNDMVDQRDAALQDLNKLIQASSSAQSDGSIIVSVGTGQTLVVGNHAESLLTVQDTLDPMKINVALKTAGSPVILGSDTLPGGELGGLVNFRDDSLNAIRNRLGQLAIGFAQSFNDQNQLGLDLNGQLGEKMFAVGQPIVTSDTKNTGNAVLSASIVDVNALTNSDYQLNVVAASQYELIKLNDGTKQVLSSLPQTVDGVAFDMPSGTPAVGDHFLVKPTRDQAHSLKLLTNDTRKIAAASPIKTQQANVNKGDATISMGEVVNNTALLPPSTPIVLSYDESTSTFNVSGGGAVPATPTSVAYTSGSKIVLNGNIEFSISGKPKNGDQFTISSNVGGVSDNRNILSLAKLQTAKVLDQGSSTYQSSYAQLVSFVGSQTHFMQASGDAQNNLLDASVKSSQEVSGVNLDEEAARLLQYQQAYQAAGKFLQIASSMFDTVLSIVR